MMNCELKQFHHYGQTAYLVTRDGRVLSSTAGGEPRELAQYNGKGYRRVRLRGKTFKVHRLVAQAFIPNPHHYAGNITHPRGGIAKLVS